VPDLPWSFTVIDDAAVNAFALPGGPIFITRGILTHMNSEAELASVLGHEIGHVTARHSAQQLSRQQFTQLGLGVGSALSPEIAGLAQAGGAGLQLLFLKYGRDAERQADELGFRYMLKEGWDPNEMPKMFATLQRVSAAAGGDRLPGYLATHPDPGDREAVAKKRAAEVNQPGLVVHREEYLAKVNGMPFGEDPRQGFFQGDTFVHPALKFRIDLPAGWKKQNGAAAVVAVSPGEDALVQLRDTGKATPEEASKEFLGQQGVQAASGGSSLVGLPPGSSYFRAQTDQGALAGLASFVPHGGETFGILGLTQASKLGAQDATFRKTVSSFAELKDPALLAVQAPKLQIVKVPRDMTVAEFVQQNPALVPVDEVATINGLAKDGRLAAGQQAKRLVGGVPPPK